MNEGPMDGTKTGWGLGWEVGICRVEENDGGKMETTVFKPQ